MNEKNLQDKTNSMMWSACDTLRTSIPGANYKDYALTILFVKYFISNLISSIRRATVFSCLPFPT